ncbi:MAG: hypothetical protein KGN78_00485 [Actinomycetales bacterium]|nr:hypothetical protein [Actinomycetales bacterium]
MEPDQPDLSAVIDGAGPIAGLFIILLGVALFFLWRSMNRQLRKINPDLPDGPKPVEPGSVEKSSDQASAPDN